MSSTVDIPQTLKDTLRKFRFARRKGGNAALVVKINKKELIMEEVEQFDDISLEDLAEGSCRLFPYSRSLIHSRFGYRATRERPAIRRHVLRARSRRWPQVVPACARELG